MAAAVCASRSALLTTPRTAGISRSPSGVSATPERERRSTAKPSSASSALIICDTADCVQPSSSAVIVRLPLSITFTSASYLLIAIT